MTGPARGHVSVLLVLAGLLAFGTVAAHPPDEAEEVTLSGEVVDLCCYLAHGAQKPGREDTAKECARAGQPIGLLADDGTVYLLVAHRHDTGPLEMARGLAGEQVTLSGSIVERGGMRGLELTSVGRRKIPRD